MNKKRLYISKALSVSLFLLALIPGLFSQSIIVIGDSNAAMENSWVERLTDFLPEARVFNNSIPGNTIGFDNNGRADLNTLKNIDHYLSGDRDINGVVKPDIVIVALGTNDCKKVFDGKGKEVVSNMDSLLNCINRFYSFYNYSPDILLVSPLPTSNDSVLAEKYRGAGERIEKLTEGYSALARKQNIAFLDIYHPLNDIFPYITIDGIHLNPEGQALLCRIISVNLKKDFAVQ
ncbi:MAG: hypothetical protein H6538_07105 [Bacteroidales bacterium]|nr:hypothetical protein [Bacteroidales bacterium]MCB9012833.1 hypothetical protein [Bacteroidales bacterium]